MSDDDVINASHSARGWPKRSASLFIRIVYECDDRYCRGHHSHYSLQIIPTFPACCSMTTCRCRTPSRYPYQLVDTHTQPLSSSRYSHVKKYSYSFDNQKNSYCFCMEYFVYLKCKKQISLIRWQRYNIKITIRTIFFFSLHALATSFPRIIPSAP